MTRRPSRGLIAGQPMLLGALTCLIAVVAVYIVYHADQGLPLAPTYEVEAILPDAESLGKTGDVRVAGVLVGRVHDRHVEIDEDGRARAVLTLGLDKHLEPLPADSEIRMRSVSTLGGSYVEVLPGKSREPLRGAIVSEDAERTISLHDSLEGFDPKTRDALGAYLGGYGDGLAGRGSDLNAVIAAAPDTLARLEGAMRTIAPSLGGFIRGFARLNEAVAPVAEQQAGLLRGLDATFSAPDPGDVEAATAEAPAALAAGTRGFPAQRGLLRETTRVFAALRPGLHAARGAADDIGGAATGSPAALVATRKLSPRLTHAGAAVRRFTAAGPVLPALATLQETMEVLAPTASDLRDAQVVCNYAGVLLRNLVSAVSDGTATGNWLSAGPVFIYPGPNGEAGPSSAAAAGPAVESHLHATPAPSTGEGPAPECEAGNEAYAIGRQAIGAPGRQVAATERTR